MRRSSSFPIPPPDELARRLRMAEEEIVQLRIEIETLRALVGPWGYMRGGTIADVLDNIAGRLELLEAAEG